MSGHIDETATVISTEVPESSNVWKSVFLKECKLGKSVNIGDFTRAENSDFKDNVNIQRNSLIYSSSFGRRSYSGKNLTMWYADVGAFCSVSWNVGIGGANHDYSRVTTHAFLYSPYMGLMGDNDCGYDRFDEPCVIGNDVWIGANSIICRNVHIGDGAVIAAGAVVTKNVEPYTIVAGVPAKPIKKRFDDETIKRLLDIKWWDFDDSTIRDNFKLFNSKPSECILKKMEEIKNRVGGR